MTMTGPQKYPSASLSEWYHDRYQGAKQEVDVIVLHTTEGANLVDYSKGAVAPNFTALPDFKNKKLVWYQHYDFDESSRALVNASGGVETNTNNVTQIELVGTCSDVTSAKWTKANADHIYWPEAPDWALQDLAEFLAWANKNHGIPLTGPTKWIKYPDSYGTSNGTRMTYAEWNAFKGICGHEHVPENYHGDPGNIDFAKLVTLAKAIVTPVKSTGAITAYEPFPGKDFFHAGKKSTIILAMHKRLVAVGCNKYTSKKNLDTWGSGDVASYKAWQHKCGFTGDAANGIPGKESWAKLKVPNV